MPCSGRRACSTPQLPPSKVIHYLLLSGELPDEFYLLGAVYILVRRKMVHDKHYLVLVKNLFRAGFPELFYRERRW